MKIKSVTIKGMHNTDRVYAIDDSVYLHGPNGAGKSTVLQAIQLAILGYIPGYGKTKADIMSHAKSDHMYVKVDFDDGSFITRTFDRSKSTIKTSVDTNISELSEILGNAELPIFRYSEFVGMTANKLKDWFISFLPKTDSQIDWYTELTKALFQSGIESDDLDLSIIKKYAEYAKSHGDDPMSQTKALNIYLKDERSREKGSVDRLLKTVESLIYYDDADTSQNPDEIRGRIAELNKTIKNLRDACNANYETHADLKPLYSRIDELCINLSIKTLDDNLHYHELIETCEAYERDLRYYNEKITEFEDTMRELNAKIAKCEFVVDSPDMCPYCEIMCDTLESIRDKMRTDLSDYNEDISEVKQQFVEMRVLIEKTTANRDRVLREIKAIEDAYSSVIPKIVELEHKLIDNDTIAKMYVEIKDAESEIEILNDTLAKAMANQRFNQLSEQLTKERFKSEKLLEALKVLINLTDVNGMQTRIMREPFERFVYILAPHIADTFGAGVMPAFELAESANSFEFGIERGNKFIPYDQLSSGEKCMYAIALLVSIVESSDAKLKLIIMDDMFDHLDRANADRCFETLYKVCAGTDIQAIVAGVITCGLKAPVTIQI